MPETYTIKVTLPEGMTIEELEALLLREGSTYVRVYPQEVKA